MSLATRCSSCGTVFRVVQDQLKISEGWVRCGRCNEVFNALEGLFDLGRDLPVEWNESGPAEGAGPAPPAAPPQGAVEAGGAPPAASGAIFGIPPSPIDGLLADPIDAHLFRKRGAEGDRSPAVQVDARDRLEFSDARFDSDLFAENPALDTTLVEVLSTGVGDLPLESESQQPDFLRRADRRARWRSAPARLALVAMSTVAAVVLLLQIGHHFRDALAAQWPSTKPVLAAWCRSAGCTVEAPRRIDDISIDSDSLTRAVGLDASVLGLTLRARGHVPLTMPWVDLSLTDGDGHLIARRALSPHDLGAPDVLQPGATATLQAMLNTINYRVAGYIVVIFYP
jgi:predicted Zn finger-like uncharacterized protein